MNTIEICSRAGLPVSSIKYLRNRGALPFPEKPKSPLRRGFEYSKSDAKMLMRCADLYRFGVALSVAGRLVRAGVETATDAGKRNILPTRRPSATLELEHDGQSFTITIGFDPKDARIMEVFADTAKQGTAMGHILADACVIISLALQFGAPVDALGHSLGKVPDPMNGEDAHAPASVLGTICAALEGFEI